MDDIMMQSLSVSRDLIAVTLEDTSITSEYQQNLMALWHQISAVIGYPANHGR